MIKTHISETIPVTTNLRIAVSLGLLMMVLATGCQHKAETTPTGDLKLVKDDVREFEVKLPSNWLIQTVPGEVALATSSQDKLRRFLEFSKGEGGAHVEFRAVPIDSTKNLDSLVKNSKLAFADGLDRYQVSAITLGGVQGKKLSVEFDQEDGKFKSETYFAVRDSVVSILQFAAFGNTFDEYKDQFAEILASVKLAKRPKVVEQKIDTIKQTIQPPSDTLRPVNTADFAIQIPQNFESSKGKVSGVLSSMNFYGSRLDCSIQVDVFSAAKQKNLDKILEENKKTYGGNVSSTTLGGVKTGYFSYNPNASISSRAYFAVKGDKMFRITMNWYKPEQSLYLPVFEKSIKTITFN